jgi:hypothetical protein
MPHTSPTDNERPRVQSPLGQLDHRLVEIERRHAARAEAVQDYFGADPLPATDLQHVLARQIAAGQSVEPRSLAVVLTCGPHGVGSCWLNSERW